MIFVIRFYESQFLVFPISFDKIFVRSYTSVSRNLNESISCEHWKELLEGTINLKEKKGYICKANTKDDCFSVPYHSDSQKFVRFTTQLMNFYAYISV